jgi:hypothetical protein
MHSNTLGSSTRKGSSLSHGGVQTEHVPGSLRPVRWSWGRGFERNPRDRSYARRLSQAMHAGGSEHPAALIAQTRCGGTLSPPAGSSRPESGPGARLGTHRTASHRNNTSAGGGPILAVHRPPIRVDGVGRSGGSLAVASRAALAQGPLVPKASLEEPSLSGSDTGRDVDILGVGLTKQS